MDHVRRTLVVNVELKSVSCLLATVINDPPRQAPPEAVMDSLDIPYFIMKD